jgi:hypothetical protein
MLTYATGEEASQATRGLAACIDQDNTNNVWRHNLEEAFKEIAQIVQTVVLFFPSFFF